jgi:hypothetical protein
MPPDPFLARAVSRRAFLGGGIAAAGGLVLAGAMGDAAFAGDSASVDPKTFFPLVFSSDLYASTQPQRMVFALSHGGKNGIQFASGPSVSVRFRPPGGGAWTPLTKTTYDRVGLPKGRGVYVTDATFATSGTWKVEARAQGSKIPFTIAVNPQPAALVPGMPAPKAASPTVADTLGVKPICTRDPMCPLHTQSLSTVIGAGKPVAALFATPARCQSAYCGPVLDEFLKVSAGYGDAIVPVHIEIYQAPTGTALVPTLAAWQIESEPWLFGVDATGMIQSRIDGAFGGNEMKAVLDQLVGKAS